MPVQTSKKQIYFPDGAKLSVKEDGASVYTDVGAINSAINNVLNWEENQVNTANAGETDKQIRNMSIDGTFTLINLEPEGVAKLSGGFMTATAVAGTPFTDAPDQVVSSGDWADVTPIALNPTTAALTAVRATALALTSVTGSVDGALTADDDYTLISDPNSYSGYSIIPNTAGTNLTTIVQDLTIDYASITPVASTVIEGGNSTYILKAAAIRITHTDDNGKIRQLDLYAVDANSGGFQFNFKGANEDGLEEMPISYAAKLDTTRAANKQLFSWTIEDGAM